MPVWRSMGNGSTLHVRIMTSYEHVHNSNILVYIASYTAGNTRSTLQEVFPLNPRFIPHIPYRAALR